MKAPAAPLRQIIESPIPAFLIKEIREALPAMVFFAIGFNLIVLTTQLILDDYGAQLAGFMVATATALVVGKVVLVARALPFFRRFDTAPLILPIVFKTVVYWAIVFLARFLKRSWSSIYLRAAGSAIFRNTSRRISLGTVLARSKSGYSFCS